MSEAVDILINTGDGKITIAYNGFVGDACYAVGKEILKELHALGVEVSIDEIIPQESPIPVIEKVPQKVRA